MTYVRWFGVIFGSLAVSIQPEYPAVGVERAAWALIIFLGLGNLAIWGALGRVGNDRSMARLAAITFAFDIAIVCGIVWVFAYEEPYVTWALLFVIPMEGALRYRFAGAFGGAAVVALFFVAQSVRVADLQDASFDFATYVFVTGFAILVAGVTGIMAQNWHEQRSAYQQQSLKLAEVDRLKDRFLAITSHEIRGPLTAIITGVDTVNKRGDRLAPEQQERLLEMVSLQGNQQARLVDDLLVTAQIQGGRPALHPEWSQLEGVIARALEAAAPRRRAHRLEIFVEPVECRVDPSRLAQISRNLVENAYKYTPDRARVAVTAKRVDGGIEVEVADEGPGIPPDKRDLLFAAFSRIEETAAGQEGVGLGLYVVSQLVAVMGGRIDLASSSRGTKFAIHLPCRVEPLATPRFGVVQGDAP
jgi:signal transduction histidine kinase